MRWVELVVEPPNNTKHAGQWALDAHPLGWTPMGLDTNGTDGHHHRARTMRTITRVCESTLETERVV